MEAVIVDTSVWVDYFRGIHTPRTHHVTQLLKLTNQCVITPTILQEALQGIRDDNQFIRLQINLLACRMLRLDPVEAAVGAASLYRTIRKKGLTIRKPNDCLIAHYAIVHGIPLLQNDVDFELISQHTPLLLALV